MKKLENRVKSTQQLLDKDRELKEKLYERQKLIDSSPQHIQTEFWCSSVGKDFVATGGKVVEKDWIYPYQKVAYYIAIKPICGCRTGAHRRFITDKLDDPYFKKSQKLKEERQKYWKDFLQPGQEGFQTHYGDPNKEVNEQLEYEERSNWKPKVISKVI